ncbi:hypothetical protein PAECIP111890_01434 [Paenibacillus sp. JJ-223]|nr:hypothetical protein PAECIP111890_01434 [Paenibacillus sp. JJ-223]
MRRSQVQQVENNGWMKRSKNRKRNKPQNKHTR